MAIETNVSASFRDPNGHLFSRDGIIYRHVNFTYKENYDHLMSCGLYKALVDAGLLIPHEELEFKEEKSANAYKILKPQAVSFISYPYEWCFSQLKDAALATLKIQKIALDFGMSMKDSSAYNIQFLRGKPVLIDILSFEKYQQGRPWIAYRQFCQHFLAPLALASYRDIRLLQLLRIYIDGIPLDLASSLLPFRSNLMFSISSHIHLHAKSQRYFANRKMNAGKIKMNPVFLKGLIDNLEGAVKRLQWQPKGNWIEYYKDCGYSTETLSHKKQLVEEFLDYIKPKVVWDLGANTGVFSRIASKKGIMTVSFDIDAAAVEKNYQDCVKNSERDMLPLVIDLTNPSPSIGWENNERLSLLERGPADAALALALIHHLAISNNTPLNKIADFFSRICNALIIEFIPKSDPQAQRLLSTREDIFCGYTQKLFEDAFCNYFSIKNSVRIKDSQRILYLMQRK